MGIDVNLYAECEPSLERLNAAEAYLTARSDIGDAWGGDTQILVIDDAEWLDRPRVAVQTLARYYGPGYERGDWPRIYGAIRILQAAFPEARVFYGGDSSDDGQECTEEFLAGIWEHFLSPNGDDYHQRHQ